MEAAEAYEALYNIKSTRSGTVTAQQMKTRFIHRGLKPEQQGIQNLKLRCCEKWTAQRGE